MLPVRVGWGKLPSVSGKIMPNIIAASNGSQMQGCLIGIPKKNPEISEADRTKGGVVSEKSSLGVRSFLRDHGGLTLPKLQIIHNQ